MGVKFIYNIKTLLFMDNEELEMWKKAGKITAEAREYAKSLVVPGASVLEVTKLVEKKIYDLGAEPAFPVTMGINQVAAHYAADFNDSTIFTENDVVKIDLGAQIEGYIGDTAVTVDLSGKYDKLLEASQEALKAAISIAKAGTEIGKIGRVIQNEIESRGFAPIMNLSGHGITRFDAHSSPSIPNYDTGSSEKLKAGTIIAIEPFATDGKGMIKESVNATIFSQIDKKPVRNMIARKVLKEVERFNTLPFNYRWLSPPLTEGQIKFGLRQLLQAGIVKDYPPLPEVQGGMVSQFEHTLYIGENETIILTK